MPVGATYRIEQWPGEVISFNQRLEVKECPTCHIPYAIPEEMANRMRKFNAAEYPKNSAHCYCPNGHSVHNTGASEEYRERERLRAELAQAKRDMDGTLDELNRTEKERRRILKRIEAGVCTECNRTFQNLAAHMDKKHGHGPTGSLVTLTEVTFVHKQQGQQWQKGRGYIAVRCGAARIHSSKAAYRWKDVTCPDCRAREFGN
jgi:hypothetical protein